MKSRERIDPKRISNKFHPEYERLYRILDIDDHRLLLVRLGVPNAKSKWYDSSLVKLFVGSEEDYLGYERKLRGMNRVIEDDPDLSLTCTTCGGTFGEDLTQSNVNVEWIECSRCLHWFHYACVGLEEEPVDELWYCPDCQGGDAGATQL